MSVAEEIAIRVLAVDHDKESQFLLRNLFGCCQYQVTVTLADKSNMALELVKDKKKEFDLIIIEKEMPDMDGFMFLQLITLETDIPVILMSSNTNSELMENAMRYGAYFVLPKPLTIEMITCVITKHKVESVKRDISDVSIISKSKRKIDDLTNQKKARCVWTEELHKKFVDAFNELEANGDAVPKKILELMNVENLTKVNVASHLQKHRLNLKNQEAARNKDSSHGFQSNTIQSKTIEKKTRRMATRRPRTDLSKMISNNFHPQPISHHQCGQLTSIIRPIPPSGMLLQTPNEMRKNQQRPLDCFNQMFFNNNNNRLPMPAPNHSFLAGNQEQDPVLDANGNILQQLPFNNNNRLSMPAPSNSFLAAHHAQPKLLHQSAHHQVPSDANHQKLRFPIPASGMLLQNTNEMRKYEQVPILDANGTILQQLIFNNNSSLPMPAPSNSFLAGNHQEQSGFSNQFSGFNVPNNRFEVPIETNLDANQTGLYRNMEFGDEVAEMMPAGDFVSDTHESYLTDKEKELPRGFMDLGDGSLSDLVNSCTNK